MERTSQEEKDLEFDRLASAIRRKAAAEIKKHKKLLTNLETDLERHGDPEKWKRFGDLLLANPSALRIADKLLVTDYFSEGTPTLEIEAEPNDSVSEAAERYFRLYSKARNARRVIEERRSLVEGQLQKANRLLHVIDEAIGARDIETLQTFVAPEKKPIAVLRKKKQDVEFKGARRFVSSDGFEILVGKKATDNDLLTFRVARSLDMWMHAADYPGSHVVIRNPGRKVIPDRTLLEAAQLAAFYSDARQQPKAAVNYTLKKFVNKPKKAAPGLVSLSSFKTILVQPQVAPGVTQP